MTAPDGAPEWWSENERLKAELGLPGYEPPRFSDGTYAYEVVEQIESAYDCRVRFLGLNARYRDDWEVRVDGETVFEIGRRRDDNGNTIYQTSAERFEKSLREYLSGRERAGE